MKSRRTPVLRQAFGAHQAAWLLGSILLALLLAIRAGVGEQPIQKSPSYLEPTGNLLLQKQYAQADALLRKLLPDHEDSAEAHIMLAYALFREDKPAESLQQYTRAAQLRQPSAEDLKWVAMDYVLLKDYSDAERWLAQSLLLNAGDEQSWYSMGRIEYTRNLFAKAQKCFEHALALAPHDVRAENNLGLTYEALNKSGAAIAAYQNAIDWQQGSGTEDAQPYLNLGTILLHENHLDSAYPMLQRAAAIAPADVEVLTQLAKANYQLGKFSDAETELRTALSAAPNEASLHFELGRTLRKEGKIDAAKVQFAQAAALDGTRSSLSR